MTEQSVLVRKDGRVGRIVLNRPRALNALDLEMIRHSARALELWRADPSVHAVVIEGAGERAFCAGGDIRAVRANVLAGEPQAVESFFSEEYALNRVIAEYPKPYIALIDGICMGGGIGLSVHGAYRVATEHALFAMPETAIGFLPDIGASHMLPRLPGALGIYLGLTGTRLAGADGVHAGLATHFVPRERLAALSAALAEDGPAVLGAHAQPLPPFSLAPHRAAIDRCFTAPTIPELIRRLEAEGTDFAAETIATLRSMSPSSLFWSLEILARGARSTLAQALETELALTRTVTPHNDFLEGVRAMVVDKDRSPKWQPAQIEAVRDADIAKLFG